MTAYQPRPYQLQAIADLRASVASGKRAPVLVMPCGMGKTIVAANLILGAVDKGRRVLFLAPRRELVFQTSEKLTALAIPHGIMMAGERPSMMPDVQVASVQTLFARYFRDHDDGAFARELPPADLIVIDECFPGDTMILTPMGPKRIDCMRSGDSVYNLCGVGVVRSVMARPANETYRLRFDDGSEIECTGNHPFFTEYGWIQARNLEVGTFFFSVEGMRFLWDNVQALDEVRGERGPCIDMLGGDLGQAGVLLDIVCEEIQKSDEQAPVADEDEGNAKANQAQAYSSRRERAIAALGAACLIARAWGGVGSGARGDDGYAERFGVSNMLQAGYSQPEIEDRDRGGWGFSYVGGQKDDGCEESCVPRLPRLVDISRIEHGSAKAVFNLHVSGHPSYFANGKAVHNCHANMSAMTTRILEAYPKAVRIGLTATPARSDGRGLGEHYDDMVFGPSVADGTEMGMLVPLRYFGADKADLSKVRMQAGDYHKADLGEAMNQPKLVGDVVQNWLRLCPDRLTVVFAVNRAHAMALQQEFQHSGVSAGYIDGETPNDERHEIFAAMVAGEMRVLCSVDVVSMGWDMPQASCGIIARPTKSVARYLQMVGRIMRIHPSKSDAWVIDHAGAVDELGFADDPQPWSLDGKSKIQERKAAAKAEPNPIECSQCHRVFKPAKICPGCGHDMGGRAAKAIEAHQAELQEIDRKTREPKKATMADKQAWWSGFLHMARERGKSDRWVLAQYKSKFGVWPRGLVDTPLPPTPEVVSWEHSQRIRWAKGGHR